MNVGRDNLAGLLLVAAALHAGLVEKAGGEDFVALLKAVQEQEAAVAGHALGAALVPAAVTDLARLWHCPVLDEHAAVRSDRAIAQREVIGVVLVTQPWASKGRKKISE